MSGGEQLPHHLDGEPETVGEFVMPNDTPEPTVRVPQRGDRKRLLGVGEGDVCIYIICDGEDGIPKGALLPAPDTPRFESVREAKHWLAAESGDKFANRQVMIFKACEIINVAVTMKPTISLMSKSKLTVKSKNAGASAE